MLISTIYLVIAISIGLLWPVCLAAALLIPVLWTLAPNRWVAGALVLAYQLAASRGLPGGTAVFFGDDASMSTGLAVWLGAAIITAIPYLIFYSKKEGWPKAAGLLAALTLHALSPVGYSHPITGLGEVMPGTGILGIELMIMVWLMFALNVQKSVRYMPAMLLISVSTMAVAGENIKTTARGIDTHFARLAGDINPFAQYDRIVFVEDMAVKAKASEIIVLPETVLGTYNAAMADRLKAASSILKEKNAVILAGLEMPVKPATDSPTRAMRVWAESVGQPMADPYYNALMPFGADDKDGLVQHTPVPISMWIPFLDLGAIADPYAAPSVLEINGMRVEAAICYEQLLTYPMLQIVFDHPDVIAAPSNGWWARNTTIPAIQEASMKAWAKLAGSQLIVARNL